MIKNRKTITIKYTYCYEFINIPNLVHAFMKIAQTVRKVLVPKYCKNPSIGKGMLTFRGLDNEAEDSQATVCCTSKQ